MTFRAASGAVAPAAALFLAGCFGAHASEDEGGGPPTPRVVVFEGAVDPNFAGTWKTKGGNSTLILGKDGALKSETISYSPAGRSDTKVSGQWLVKDGRLTLKYPGKTKEQEFIQYTAELSGKTLTLNLAGGRLKTVYTRN
jgi:hypothetical protein